MSRTAARPRAGRDAGMRKDRQHGNGPPVRPQGVSSKKRKGCHQLPQMAGCRSTDLHQRRRGHGQSINRTPNVQGATHVLEQTGCASTSAGALCNFERRPASGIPALVSVCRDTTSHDALGLVTPSFVTVPNDTVLRQIHTGAS